MRFWLSVRLDFEIAVVDHAEKGTRLGEILTRPCFCSLRRASVRRGDLTLQYTKVAPDAITSYLLDRTNEALALDSGRSNELTATGQIQNGTYPAEYREPTATRFYSYLAFPPDEVDSCVAAVVDLAAVVEATAGFVAVEPSYSRAQEVALGGRLPRERVGLSDLRRRERRARDWHQSKIHNELAGVEWGTFLGAEHLQRIDLDAVRRSNAFERVVQVSPRLAFLQVTNDPTDDLREDCEDFEVKLERARSLLRPIMMDLSDVNLSDVNPRD